MAHSTPARKPDLITRAIDLKCTLRSARDEQIPSVEVAIQGGDEHSSVAGQVKAENCLQHWRKKSSTTQEADRARNVPVASNIFKTKVADQGTDRYV